MQPGEERPTALASLTAESAHLAEELRHVREELEHRTDALERSEARFRAVIEHNADAIVVVDGDGLIRFANAMATRLFGGTRAELVGSPFGFPLVTEETTEVDLLWGGTPRVAEMRVVQSEWESHVAYIASLRDITERKRAEQAARALIGEQAARAAAETAADRFRFLSESSAVLSSSLDCRTILATLARVCVTGVADWAEVYFVDDTGAVKRLEVAHCDSAKADVMEALRDVLVDPESNHPVLHVVQSRKPLLVDSVEADLLATTITDARHADIVAKLGMVSLMMMPLVARDRALGAMALVSSDTTRRFNEQDLALVEDIAAHGALALDNALLYEETRKANRTKSDLLAVVSHDLRTPLNAVIGYAELLMMGIPEPVPDSARERLQRIRTSAKHLLYLLDDLLSFARLEAGHEEPHLQDLDVRTVIREMAAVIEPLALAAGLQFELDMPQHAVMIQTDPDKLRQVLVNLGGNAVKYTKEGKIRVALREEGANRAAIDVSDTGIGIAPEHLEQIFEPFWQVDETQRGHDRGTGLGLSVVRELVRLLGGEVSVESARGQGSTFSVRLRGQRD